MKNKKNYHACSPTLQLVRYAASAIAYCLLVAEVSPGATPHSPPAAAPNSERRATRLPTVAAPSTPAVHQPPPADKPSSRRTTSRSPFEGMQVSAALQPEKLALPANEPETIPPGIEVSRSGMSLADVTGVAMANSPQIREAAAQAVAARGRAFQASRYPNPTMGHSSPQLAGNQSQYNAYVIQDLVTKNKIGLDTAAAERAAWQAELMLVRARFDVLTMVRQRFYTALAAQQRVEVLEAMVKIARTSHDVSERLLTSGVGTRGDVLQLQVELSTAEAELKNAHTLAYTSKRQLAAATGLINLEIDRVQGDLAQPMIDYELMAVQQGVLSRNALAQSAQVEIGRTQFQLRRAVVEPFPNLNMMGGYQNQQPEALAPTVQAVYQLQMVIPLWNRNQGNIRAAQAGVSAASAQLQRVQTELANDSASSIGRFLTARQLADRYQREILPSAVELQKISSQLYRVGEIDFLRYLVSQRTLLNASLSYISAHEARWLAGAEVAGLLQSEQFP